MINISYKVSTQMITAVEITGHADYAEYGQDIVCAAVSSQAISVENSLQHLLKIPVLSEVNEIDGGFLKITLPEISKKEVQEDAQLLMRHLIFSLERLADTYPEYITIKEYSAN